MFTQEELAEIVEYDPETGVFQRLIYKHGHTGWVEKKTTGTIDACGYVRFSILGKSYYAHRLAFLAQTGVYPAVGVDHIDGNRSNNKWANLRLATQAQNMQNRSKNRNNTTGHPGVVIHKGKISAIIRRNGVQHWLGTFKTVEEAGAAYMLAKSQLHPFTNPAVSTEYSIYQLDTLPSGA